MSTFINPLVVQENLLNFYSFSTLFLIKNLNSLILFL